MTKLEGFLTGLLFLLLVGGGGYSWFASFSKARDEQLDFLMHENALKAEITFLEGEVIRLKAEQTCEEKKVEHKHARPHHHHPVIVVEEVVVVPPPPPVTPPPVSKPPKDRHRGGPPKVGELPPTVGGPPKVGELPPTVGGPPEVGEPPPTP